jgi:hypothetical protein
MSKKSESANNIPLIPLEDFKDTVKSILNVSKEESDKQIAELQASNAAVRQAKAQKKRGAKPKEK